MSFVLTLVVDRRATTLAPSIIARVRETLKGREPVVLSPGEAVDIPCLERPDPVAVDAALEGAPVDAIATPARGRRKGLLLADMDSTIITTESLDELAGHVGLKERIAAITARAMNGELDFAAAVRERVGMLRGLKLEALRETVAAIELTDGARELVRTMRAHNALTALISGGFSFFTSTVAARVGFDLDRSNVLLDDGRVLTGEVREPIQGKDAKLAALHELAARRGLRMSATLAVGDGANDLPMILEAGLGVAFHAKPMVAASATARVNHAGLRALLFAQGYRAEEFVA